MNMRKTTLAPRQLSCSVRAKLPRQGGLPGVAPGQRKTHVNS